MWLLQNCIPVKRKNKLEQLTQPPCFRTQFDNRWATYSPADAAISLAHSGSRPAPVLTDDASHAPPQQQYRTSQPANA